MFGVSVFGVFVFGALFITPMTKFRAWHISGRINLQKIDEKWAKKGKHAPKGRKIQFAHALLRSSIQLAILPIAGQNR